MNRQPFDKKNLDRHHGLTSSLLALSDGLAVIAIAYAATLWTNQGTFPEPYVVMLLLLLGVMGLMYDRQNVYQHHGSFLKQSLALIKAYTLSFAILLALGFLAKQSDAYSRLALAVIFVGGLFAQLGIHVAARLLLGALKNPQHNPKALIVGTGTLSDHLYYKIADNPWILQTIEGAVKVFDDDPPPSPSNLKVLGKLEDVIRLVDERNIRTVYLAVRLDASPLVEDVYFALLDRNVNVHWAPNIFSLNLINHSIGELGGIPLITLSETPLLGTSKLTKDIEDRLLAIIILMLVSPIMIATAIAVKLSSPGPVFFRQPRTGWDGKVFHIWKFRSMRVHQPKQGTIKQATKDDPRVTRVGRFIRRTSIDELPQLFNVLAGDMSLVGPRPHAVEHNKEYAGKITAYLARHRIKPGITGLAQVRGYRGETKDLEQMAKRVEYDIEYINNWSVWLDMVILARTALTLFSKNAY